MNPMQITPISDAFVFLLTWSLIIVGIGRTTKMKSVIRLMAIPTSEGGFTRNDLASCQLTAIQIRDSSEGDHGYTFSIGHRIGPRVVHRRTLE
jgi:hypothetical protein